MKDEKNNITFDNVHWIIKVGVVGGWIFIGIFLLNWMLGW